MSVNKCIFIGNLTSYPEIRIMPNGEQVANFSIALNDRYKAKDGNIVENVEYVRVVFYRRQAEVAGEYLRKGSKVYVEGRLKTRKWKDQNGQNRYATEIIGDVLQMLDSRASGEKQDKPCTSKNAYADAKNGTKSAPTQQSADDFDDDIPF